MRILFCIVAVSLGAVASAAPVPGAFQVQIRLG